MILPFHILIFPVMKLGLSHLKGLVTCYQRIRWLVLWDKSVIIIRGLLRKIWAELPILVLTKMNRISHVVIVVCISAFRFWVRLVNSLGIFLPERCCFEA